MCKSVIGYSTMALHASSFSLSSFLQRHFVTVSFRIERWNSNTTLVYWFSSKKVTIWQPHEICRSSHKSSCEENKKPWRRFQTAGKSCNHLDRFQRNSWMSCYHSRVRSKIVAGDLSKVFSFRSGSWRDRKDQILSPRPTWKSWCGSWARLSATKRPQIFLRKPTPPASRLAESGALDRNQL